MKAVAGVAAIVHPDLFERTEVLAEKQRLYPDGAWLCEIDGTVGGYLLSHPWRASGIPPLDMFLGALPTQTDTYYIHDLALLPECRGIGAAGFIVRAALQRAAEDFSNAALVAVNDSQAFWQLRGFEIVDVPELAAPLHAYEADAKYMTQALVAGG